MKLEVIKRTGHQQDNKPPLVFVHGAAGGAWYFEHFLDYFDARGYDCYAVSLKGHGQSEGYEDLDSYGLIDYVSDIKSVIDTLDKKPILIGHSMGGAITQKYIGLHQDDLEAAILLASAQAGGIEKDSPLGLFFSDAKSFLRLFRKAHPGEKISLEKIINDTIFSNRFNHHELREIRKRLTKESALVKKDLLKPFIPDDFKIRIKIGVIGSTGDHIVHVEQTIKTADAFGVKPVFVDNVCHFMTIDPQWELPAAAILKWIGENFS